MRNLVILFMILLFFGQLAAQTFQKEYDFGNQESIVESILLDDGQSVHFVAKGMLFDNFAPLYEDCLIIKLDSNGLFLGSTTINGFYAFDAKSFNDTLAIYGTSTNKVLRSSLLFYLDSALTILDTIEYKDSLNVIFSATQCEKSIKNHSVQLVTEIDTSNFNLTSKVLEYNQLGTLIQQQVYDNSGDIDNLGGGSISYHPILRKYYILQSGSYNPNASKYGSIHRFDKNYQIEKSTSLNTGLVDTLSFDTTYLSGPFYLIVLANGNIAVSGNFDQVYINQSLPPGSFNEAGLIIYDTNLTRLNVHTVSTTDTSDVPAYQAIISDSNYIYWVCNTNWSFVDYYVPQTTHFKIIKMDLNGNYISERNYSNGKFTKINSIIRTADNGFLLSGSTYDSINNLSEGLNAYILCLDSAGNLITGIKENKRLLSNNDFLIYPNPANDVINFQKVNYFEAYDLSIYDINGKVIEQFSWTSDQMQVSIGNFSNGIYFYRVQGKELGNFSGKFIKK